MHTKNPESDSEKDAHKKDKSCRQRQVDETDKQTYKQDTQLYIHRRLSENRQTEIYRN